MPCHIYTQLLHHFLEFGQPHYRHSCYAMQMLQKGLVESMRMGESAYWLHVAGCRNPYADARQLLAMAPAEIQGVNRLSSNTIFYLTYSHLTISFITKVIESGPSLHSILTASRTASGLSQCFVTDGTLHAFLGCLPVVCCT